MRLINRYSLADIQVYSILDNIHYTQRLSKEYGEVISLGYDFKEPKDLEEFCSMFFSDGKINTFTINMFKNNLITYQDIQNKNHKKEIADYKNKVKKEIKTISVLLFINIIIILLFGLIPLKDLTDYGKHLLLLQEVSLLTIFILLIFLVRKNPLNL